MTRVGRIPGARWLVAAALVTGGSADAQPAARFTIGAALGAHSLPSAFSSRCTLGRDSDGAIGAAASLLAVFRPRGVFVVRSDVEMNVANAATGCDAVGHVVILDADRQALLLSPVYARHVPQYDYATTTVRAGVETPRGVPLVRALVGGGFVVGSRGAVPMAVASLGTGTRGRRRVFLEAEYATTRVSARQPRRILDRRGVAIGADTVPLRMTPKWGEVRAGVEFALGGAR